MVTNIEDLVIWILKKADISQELSAQVFIVQSLIALCEHRHANLAK
jgi:hypothetical protein